MPVQITELLNKLQQIFQQADLSKLQVSFTYTPTPGSWQAAVQSDGLPGLIGWLQKDDAKGGNTSDKKVSDTKPADNGSPSSDLLGAINHIGQLFIAMVKPDPAAPSDAKRSPDKKDAPPATQGTDALQAFNKLLTDLMPSKAPPNDDKSTSPNSTTTSPDKTTNQPEWRSWAEKGLDTFNKLLGDSIKTATGKKTADSDDNSTSQDKKDTQSTSKDEDDSDTSDDESNDKKSDDTDDESDTSDSDSNDDDSGSDTPDVEDAEIVDDTSRDHLLDV